MRASCSSLSEKPNTSKVDAIRQGWPIQGL